MSLRRKPADWLRRVGEPVRRKELADLPGAFLGGHLARLFHRRGAILRERELLLLYELPGVER